ncbi:cytochrome P450 [Fennellomyces sp. T-0311]|nr:cytochrome P450 [Fennellomyces sp. T-0311]
MGTFLENMLNTPDNQIDILKHVELAVMNVLLIVCVGKSLSSIDDPLFKELIAVNPEGPVHASFEMDMKTFLPVFSILDYMFFRPQKARFVSEKLYSLYGRLHLDGADEIELIVTMIDIVTAGTPLVTFALAWSVIILCCQSDAQKVIQSEIDEFVALHKRLSTFDDRTHLPHLISIQKECICYRPVDTIGLLHESTSDVTCRGYHIPKGTTIMSNMISMHNNPDVYNEPEKFDPDRFLNNLKTMSASAHANAQEQGLYIFGWGRCILVQIFTILVQLLVNCDIKPPIGQDNESVYPDLDNFHDDGLFMSPKDTVVRIRKRENALVKS